MMNMQRRCMLRWDESNIWRINLVPSFILFTGNRQLKYISNKNHIIKVTWILVGWCWPDIMSIWNLPMSATACRPLMCSFSFSHTAVTREISRSTSPVPFHHEDAKPDKNTKLGSTLQLCLFIYVALFFFWHVRTSWNRPRKSFG